MAREAFHLNGKDHIWSILLGCFYFLKGTVLYFMNQLVMKFFKFQIMERAWWDFS